MSKVSCAAVDVGSNAVRFAITEYQNNGKAKLAALKPLVKHAFLRLPVRLADYEPATQVISQTKISSLVLAFEAFNCLMRVFGVSYYKAVATSAVREAANAKQVKDVIFEKTGILLDVISPYEEALITINGVLNQIDGGDKNVLHIDIGGGSTEVSLIQNNVLTKTDSFNLGTVKLFQGKVAKGQWDNFANTVKQTVALQLPAIFSGSGAIEPMLDLIKTFKKTLTKERLIYLDDLIFLKKMLDKKNASEIANIFKISLDKAELATYAAGILICFMQAANSTKVLVTSASILDHLLWIALQNKQKLL